MKRRLISLLLVVTMTASLAACGSSGSATTTSGDASGTATGGVDVTACIASEPETIDPSLNSTVDGGTYIQHTFEGLMKYETVDGEMDPEVVPGQAASEPEVSDDGLTYTFTLRDDIYWSDGEPVTAQDFVYSWQRLVDPATGSDYAYIINMVQNAQEIQNGEMTKDQLGITAVDDKTLQITLVSPCAYFLELCAFPSLVPLREDVVDGNDSWTFDNYVCNGKYVISEWNHDESIVMERNTEYYDQDEVKTNSITWKLMDDVNAMLADYQSGELDFINDVPVDEKDALLADGTLQTTPYLGTYCAVFNTTEAPFDNELVREAFSLAIDRNYIVENITKSGEEPADAWVPDGITNYADGDFREDGGSYYSVDDADYEANCEKAKELLAEAGYPDGEGFPVVTYLYNTNDQHQKIYEALAYMWQEVLGVQVTGSNQDWNVFLQSRETGDFEIARHGWIADYNDALGFLDMWTTSAIGGNNYAQWSNTDYDNLISSAISESDSTKRQEILHEAEDLMMSENIVAPIYFYTDKYCINSDLTGLSHTPLGYYFLWNLTSTN